MFNTQSLTEIIGFNPRAPFVKTLPKIIISPFSLLTEILPFKGALSMEW